MLPWLKLLVLTLTLLSSITSAQNQGVIVLTTRNFDISVRDGSIWLIEFYGSCVSIAIFEKSFRLTNDFISPKSPFLAPWCSHCKTFAPSYEVRLLRRVQSITKYKDIFIYINICETINRTINVRFISFLIIIHTKTYRN